MTSARHNSSLFKTRIYNPLRRLAFGLLLGIMVPSLGGAKDLSQWDIPVTKGAAAGYVPDQTCGNCHEKQASSFQQMGMAKSFYAPRDAPVIEDFDKARYDHAPSQRTYEMERRGAEIWFRRYRLTETGHKIDLFEVQVDWIIGSGNHSRVYLYQTQDGTMFQLPLAWYSQMGKWAMAPGFEFKDHSGVLRRVQRRCMACHNAYPDVPKGSDRPGMPEVFPVDLPRGIGCQRCHGPGAEHVELALNGTTDYAALLGSIVQPARLARRQLDSLCYSCHLQPSVAMPAPLRLGRGVYSFRPGQDIKDYLVNLDIKDKNRDKPDRFDINHHPYRLEQSSCFIESKGALGCLNCHDPHVKTPKQDRARHYRKACLACHETDTADLPVMKRGTHPQINAQDDCTLCHMPKRRTQDVVEVTMTDHRIQRDPGLAGLLAPIAKESVEVGHVSLYDPHSGLSDRDALIYKTLGILSHTNGRSSAAAAALQRAVTARLRPHYEPWLALAKSHLRRGNAEVAQQMAERGLALAPDIAELRKTHALALFAKGDKKGAIQDLRDLLAEQPGQAEQQYNLALFLFGEGDTEAALKGARKALDLRANLWPALRLIGDIRAGQGQDRAAAIAYRKALSIQPDAPRVRDALIKVLTRLGQVSESEDHKAMLAPALP